MVSERNEGFSSCTGGLVIDLTRMRGVDVNPEERVAHVQGGTFYADADRETRAFGLIVPAGVVSETEVAGLALGGSEGWVRCEYALTIDSLLSARVVCADGSVHRASLSSEPESVQALCGGGGNFRIVTSFEFRAHPPGSDRGVHRRFLSRQGSSRSPSRLARLLCRRSR